MRSFKVSIIFIFIFLWILIFLLNFCYPQDNQIPSISETKDENKVLQNFWYKNLIIATGDGYCKLNEDKLKAKIKAKQVARMNAQRNLLETIKGVYVTSETMTEDFIVKSDKIKTQIEGYLQNAIEVEEPEYEIDEQGVTCRLKMGVAVNGLKEIIASELKEKEKEKIKDKETKSKYDLIIIDCRGLKINQGLFPKIYDNEKKVVFNSLNKEVSYIDSLDEFKELKVLIIKALNKEGNFGVDIVLSKEDAQKISKIKNKTIFFLMD